VLALPGVHLHLYGKLEARAGRKMGHITITGNTIDEARQVAEQVQAILGLWH
jgi:5-(carboxyamino)imidazole ribonucleotide synthase